MTLFTVEQVELIRRLRLTGVNAEQIVDAFESLDRLDRELAPFTNPSTNGQQQHQQATEPRTVTTLASPYESILGNQQHRLAHASRRKRSVITSHQQQQNEQVTNGENDAFARQYSFDAKPNHAYANEYLEPQDAMDGQHTNGYAQEASDIGGMWPLADENLTQDVVQSERADETEYDKSSSSKSASVRTYRRWRRSTTNGNSSFSANDTTGGSSGAGSKFVPPIDYSRFVDKNELERLIRSGETEAIREIKDFVTRFQLRQQNIALMTGISQPYVSRFLSCSGKELSERVRHIMYCWYLTCKNNPEFLNQSDAFKIAATLNAVDEAVPPSMVQPVDGSGPFSSGNVPQRTRSNYYDSPNTQTRSPVVQNLPTTTSSVSSPVNKDNLASAKRERFVFKSVHVRMLEKYFALDPYPNVAKREEIAIACNRAYQSANGGAYLAARECVTGQVVGNWFSNRRKEKKRRGEMKLRRMRGPRTAVVSSVVRRTASNSYSVAPSRYNVFPLSAQAIDSVRSGTISAESNHVPSSSPQASDKPAQRSPPKTDLTVSGDGPRSLNIVNELEEVSNSVMALIDPYGETDGGAAVARQNGSPERLPIILKREQPLVA